MADRENAELPADVKRLELTGQANLLRSLGDASLDPVIATAGGDKIVYWNGRATRCFGWSEEEAKGKAVHELLIPKRLRAKHLAAVAKLEQAGGFLPPSRFVTHALRKDGSEIDVELSVIHIVVGPSRVPVCFVRDLSESQLKDKALRDAEKLLLHLSRRNAMATMASALAHELSQPIGAATNYLAAAMLQADTGLAMHEEIRAVLAECGGSLRRCSELLHAIRNLVQKGTIRPAEQSATAMVAQVTNLLSSKLPAKVSVEIESDAEFVWVDRVMIEQLLLNLIRNSADALHESKNAAITVSSKRIGDKACISVDDNGPGIPKSRRAKLFEAFRSTKPDGMGMGLAICKVLAERTGGRLWLEEKEGPGAKFCFTIPLASGGEKSGAHSRKRKPWPKLAHRGPA